MGETIKKRYEKPTVKKVRLDAKCAVLGFCKTTGKIGPGRSNWASLCLCAFRQDPRRSQLGNCEFPNSSIPK